MAPLRQTSYFCVDTACHFLKIGKEGEVSEKMDYEDSHWGGSVHFQGVTTYSFVFVMHALLEHE